MNVIEYSGRSYSAEAREPWASVLVCTLSARDPVGAFSECRENAIFHAFAHGITVQTLNVRSSAVAPSRNLCVEQWKRRDWEGDPPEYILFLDDDMLFSDEIITHLVRTAKDREAGVLGVLATGRVPPFPVCVLDKETRQAMSAAVAMRHHQAREVVEVGAVGMACTLIRTALFQDMERPYFSFYHHLDEVAERVDAVRRDLEAGRAGDPTVLAEALERMRHHVVGEDYSFCIKVAERGERVMCDFGVETPYRGGVIPGVGHIAAYAYSLLDTLATPSEPPASDS